MKIVFLNGLPRVGKDTLARAVCEIGRTVGIKVDHISSIDPVRHAFKTIGIDISEKTPELRAAMSEVGDSLENWLSFRTKWCAKEALRYDLSGYHILIIHMREPDLITKACEMLNRSGYETIKVFLEGNRAEPVSNNASDIGVWREDFYDAVLSNNAGIDELRAEAVKLLKNVKPLLAETLR